MKADLGVDLSLVCDHDIHRMHPVYNRALVNSDYSFVYVKKGKRKVKYLTKRQVQLGGHKASEVETDLTSTEDESWGVEEDDVRNVNWIISCILGELINYQ